MESTQQVRGLSAREACEVRQISGMLARNEMGHYRFASNPDLIANEIISSPGYMTRIHTVKDTTKAQAEKNLTEDHDHNSTVWRDTADLLSSQLFNIRNEAIHAYLAR